MGSFCRLPGTSGYFPCPLSALEEHNFLFQLRGGEQPPPGAKEVSWCVRISDENRELEIGFSWWSACVPSTKPQVLPSAFRRSGMCLGS